MFIESMNQPITNWLNLNYVACKNSSIPRCLIYQHYCEDFKKEGIEPLNTAMFGKVIKMAFPFIKSRRLGNRGNSKYHYFGVASRNALAQASLDESIADKLFLQKYECVSKTFLESLLERNYIHAYQEMKRFWTENIATFSTSRGVEKACLSIEKEVFGSLIRRSFGFDGLLDYIERSYREEADSAKTAAKTVSVLCRQLSTATHSKGVSLRLESYKQHSIVLNSTANMHRCMHFLRQSFEDRGRLDEFSEFLGAGFYVLKEKVPLEKLHTIHAVVASLTAFYVNATSFTGFLLGVDEAVSEIFDRNERVQYEETSAYFSGALQEAVSSGLASRDLASILCTFYLEYFCVVSNSAPHEPLFKKRALHSPRSSPAESKSYVSQIITEC